MFAVLETGGKQYKVEQGSVIQVERIAGDVGDAIELGKVLLIEDGEKVSIGSPLVKGASIKAQIVEQLRGPKLIVFKKRRRKGSRRKNGHRQELSRVRVTEIVAG